MSELCTHCWECLYQGAVIECNAPNSIWQKCKQKLYTSRNWSHSPGELQLTKEQIDKIFGLNRLEPIKTSPTNRPIIVMDEVINLFPEHHHKALEEKLQEIFPINRRWNKTKLDEILRLKLYTPTKSRWVTGITLKRYFQFTEHQMRKLRKEVGKAPPMNGKWLYDLDKVQVNHKPKTAIPEHLIREGE